MTNEEAIKHLQTYSTTSSSDDEAYHKFIKDNTEMFAQDNGMKPADEYVKEFMTRLKNGEIKG